VVRSAYWNKIEVDGLGMNYGTSQSNMIAKAQVSLQGVLDETAVWDCMVLTKHWLHSAMVSVVALRLAHVTFI
jgi:hypothetical protein